MPNPYFCFKQFTIHHDRCAMKVGTDGILLGAWADIGGALRVLDIGTGSGLIALMLAQRIKAANKFAPLIDAVEVDFSAGEQATENVRNSPWSESIRVHRSTIHSYAAPCPHRYNLIISNPPFFSSKLATEDQPRSVARHTQELTPEALAEIADQLLLEEGHLCAIYPVAQAEVLMSAAKTHNLFLSRMLRVQPTPELPVKRILVDLKRATDAQVARTNSTETIAVEVARHRYTPEFITLIQDFYLKY